VVSLFTVEENRVKENSLEKSLNADDECCELITNTDVLFAVLQIKQMILENQERKNEA